MSDDKDCQVEAWQIVSEFERLFAEGYDLDAGKAFVQQALLSARTTGADEQRARSVALIEAEMGEWYEGSSALTALARLLEKVNLPNGD